MAVYINKTYIPNNIRKEIRTHCGAQEAARYLKAKYRWTQQILDDIKWELHSSFIQKQTYSRKKTTIKYVHRWLPSGSKSFGQSLGCPYYKDDGLQHGYDHFITCDFDIERKEARMKAMTEKLNILLAPKAICKGIYRGITNNYNNTTRKKEKRNNRKSLVGNTFAVKEYPRN